jgi:hypothetical protein
MRGLCSRLAAGSTQATAQFERRYQMRKLRLLVAISLLVMAASCSSTSEPMAVEITGPLGPGETAAQITGPAVADGIVCEAATYVEGDFFDLDGKVLTDEERDQLMQVEMETGEIVFSAKDGRWTCVDGSGTFDTVDTPTMAASDLDFEGTNEPATWTVEDGTGEYEGLSGSGTVIVDFPNGTVVYDGELQK